MSSRFVRWSSLLVVLSSVPLFSQTNTSRLEGTIQDPSGAVIAGAKVAAVNQQTHIRGEVTTSTDGHYIFPALQPGEYSLTVESAGFRRASVTGISVTVGASLTQNVTLEIGAVAETIDVSANALSVQVSDAQMSQVVTMKDIDTMPQLGRSAISLSILLPGVQIDPNNTGNSRVNGTRQGSNNTTLDGMYVSDPTAPSLGLVLSANNTDSVGEFRMVTSGGKAEFGYNAGANVQLITRSGTNRFSGALFDYLRNTVLNANTFFNNTTGTPRPKFIQNFYGGSLGGPIRRDRTFFFFNFQGRRTRQEISRNRTVLTAAARQGIFQWLTPGSGALQSFNIPQSDPRRLGIDPQVAKLIALLPAPNNFDVGDGPNSAGFRFNNPTNTLEDQLTFKADHNLWNGHRIFFRYNWQHTDAIDSGNGADSRYPGQAQGRQQAYRWSFVIGSDWSLRPNMVNELRIIDRVGFTDFIRPARLPGPMFQATSTLWTDALNPAFPTGRGSPQKEVTNNLTMAHGAHTFKAGGSFRFFRLNAYSYTGVYPDVTFNRSNGISVPTTIGPNGASVISSASRTVFEDLYNNLLGRIDQVTLTFYGDLQKYLPPGDPRVRNHILHEKGFFFQDDWRVNRKLTLNLGLRYELFGVPSERDGLIGTYDKAALLNRSAQLSDIAVKPGGRWFQNDWNNFAPRFGLAWDPRGSGKTAIRMHAGLFYDRAVSGSVSDLDSSMPGFSTTNQIFPNGAGNTDARLADSLPLPPQPTSPVLLQPVTRQQPISLFNPNLRTGYVLSYGFSIQHELFRNTIGEIGYVGTRGIKLYMDEDLNQLRINEDFLTSFKEIQAFQASGAAPSPSNTLVRLFGAPQTVLSTLGATNFTQGLVGTVANNVDRQQYARYAAAGVSQFYLRNYPQFNQVIYGTNDGRSYYNSLQVSVRRQAGTLKLGANYTWSKSMDNISSDGNGFTSPIDNFNLVLNRARSDSDRPHVFNGSLIYTLPIGRDKFLGRQMPVWADRVLGGWDMGSIILWESGALFTVSSNRATAAIPGNTWANYTGDRGIGTVQERGDGVYYFNSAQIASFSFPGAGEIGTSGRNAFRGPMYYNVDLSLVKRFRIKERQAINFRWESYNLFNHPTFGGLSTNLTTPATFGKFSGLIGNPRIMQVALRYDF